MSSNIRSHKRIDKNSTFLSVFPEEMAEFQNPERWGSIDDYRASWELPDYVPRNGRVITDSNDFYDAGWDE